MKIFVKNYKKVYFFSLFGGIAFLFLAKQFSTFAKNGEGLWLQSSVLVIGWMLFLLRVLWIKSEDDYEESDADYFYYLGFIFTISTLAISFVPEILFSDGRKTISNKELLTSFGLGLITTIVGLVGRIILYLKYEKHITGAEDAVQRMSIVGDRFAKELSILTASMRSNLEEISKSYDYSSASLKDSTSNLSTEIKSLVVDLQELRKTTSHATVEIEVSAKQFVDRLTIDSTAIQDSALAFSDAITSFSASILKFKESLSVDEELSDFKQNLHQAQGAVLDFSKSMVVSRENSQSLSEQLQRLASAASVEGENLESRLHSITEVLGTYSAKLRDNLANIQNLTDTLSNSPVQIDDLYKQVNLLGDGLRGVNQNLTETTGLLSNLTEMGGKLNAVNNQFENLLKLALPVSILSGELENFNKKIKTVNEDFGDKAAIFFDTAFKSQKEFVSSLHNSQEMLDETHKALIESIKAIKSQFK
jgi:hypothetical protein